MIITPYLTQYPDRIISPIKFLHVSAAPLYPVKKDWQILE
jgi:hypothetical protein